MIKNKIDIDESLDQKWRIFDSTYDGKFTKTTMFLLPALELNLSSDIIKCIENVFIDDRNYEHNYTYPIFLLLRMKDKKSFAAIYDKIKTNNNFRVDYNVGKKNGDDLIMLVFETPLKFHNDYRNFIKGKYSKFSKDYKSKFSQFIHIRSDKKEESIVWKIINKDPEFKKNIISEFMLNENFFSEEDEIWDIPRKQREVYNY